MKRILLLASLLFIFSACSAKPNQGLTISLNPTQPFLIPISPSSSTTSGLTGPTAPYFDMNSLTITWAGSQQFELLAIEFYAQTITGTSGGTGTTFNCGGSGQLIELLFANSTITDAPTGCSGIAPGTSAINAATQSVVMPAVSAANCTISIQSLGFYCDSLPITINPNPFANYNIPVEVVVFGESLDSSGNTTGRVAGIGNINIQ